MSDADRITAGAAVVCGLAVVSGVSPAAEAVVTTIVIVALGLGALAGIIGYRVHVRRIRREIAARGGSSILRPTPADRLPPSAAGAVPPVRDAACPRALRTRRAQSHSRPGRTRYR